MIPKYCPQCGTEMIVNYYVARCPNCGYAIKYPLLPPL